MLFLILMILTGMLLKAILVLGERTSNKIEQLLEESRIEESTLLEIKIIPQADLIKGSLLNNTNPVRS